MSSTATLSAGAKFRAAVAAEKPLQLVGAINANHALLAKRAGFKAIYLSGGGVSAGSLGLPDLGISTLDDVLTDVRRITDVCDLPLMVDVDTGFGPSAFNIARTVKSLIKAGAGAMHIEDQVGAKRCGHRPGKGDRLTAGNGGSREGRSRCPDRRKFCRDGTDGCAGGGRSGSGD
jgi:methylisocitrate lyase